MRFHYTNVCCFWNLVGCFKPRCSVPQAGRTLCPFLTRHGCVHGHFQLSPRVCDGFFVIIVLWIEKRDALNFRALSSFWLLFRPFLFFSFFLSSFANSGPYFRPHVIVSRSRLSFCQSPSGPHVSFERFLF